MAQDSDDFDWVSAQATCNTTTMFERLRTQVQADVLRRNGLFGRDDGMRFAVHDSEDEEEDAFEVSRLEGTGPSPRVTALVVFARVGKRIHITSEDFELDLTAVVTLDPAGACRFVVGEAIYSEWEIRRMALELMFFEEREDEE